MPRQAARAAVRVAVVMAAAARVVAREAVLRVAGVTAQVGRATVAVAVTAQEWQVAGLAMVMAMAVQAMVVE